MEKPTFMIGVKWLVSSVRQETQWYDHDDDCDNDDDDDDDHADC